MAAARAAETVLIAKSERLPRNAGVVFGYCDGTGERRYSQQGEQHRSVQATSGPFCGEDLANGLRTLWGSPQVWYQPEVSGAWVPVTLESGSFPLRRLGVGRIEVPISFTKAAAQAVQRQ